MEELPNCPQKEGKADPAQLQNEGYQEAMTASSFIVDTAILAT